LDLGDLGVPRHEIRHAFFRRLLEQSKKPPAFPPCGCLDLGFGIEAQGLTMAVITVMAPATTLTSTRLVTAPRRLMLTELSAEPA
jgi:hypothetical protein